MKYTRIVLMMILALALVSVLPVIAQDETPTVEYVFSGTEFRQIENGVIVKTWSITDTREMLQIAAIMQARAQSSDPTIRYEFDNDRMYHLRGNQVVGLTELRGGSWIDQPALIVRYEYDGTDVRRFVNNRLQESWSAPPGIQTYGFVTMMQAQANELVAAHVSEELTSKIEHLPTLFAENFTAHLPIVGQEPDFSWYTPEFGESLASVLAVKTDDPVVMAMENLVVVREPAYTPTVSDIMLIPDFTNTPRTDLFDIYRFQGGKVTDIWLGLDLATLVQTAN